MELEKQVCSLELAKKLKELGLKQDSLYYIHHRAAGDDKDGTWINHGKNILSDEEYEWVYSAFTVAELGLLLPAGIQCNKFGPLSNNPSQKQWGWHCWQVDKNHLENADTEADARAKMLIYLLENKIL